MSGLLLVSIVLTGLWLAALTMLVLVLVRQTALVMIRLEQGGRFSVSADGLPVGTPIAPDLRAAMPETTTGSSYVLLLSATCGPCRELVPELIRYEVKDRFVTLLAGSPDVADSLAALLPAWMRVVRDPAASALADRLGIKSTPFVLQIKDGTVSGRAYLRKGEDLLKLIAPEQPLRDAALRETEVVTNAG